MHVDNQVSVIGGCPNIVITMTHHGFFDHTNPIAQHGVYDESLPSTKGSGGTVHHPLE